jgi:mutator protein MutT
VTPASFVLATLCFPVAGGRVLLGHKQRGLGAGYWNGFGGKVEPGESIEAAARRETREEIGIEPLEMRKVAVLAFFFDDTRLEIEVHVFLTEEWAGEPAATPEMRPAWYAFGDIPYAEMWPDDEQWLPLVLMGERIAGAFRFADERTLRDYAITSVSKSPAVAGRTREGDR